ncbi:hypothetical protein RHMOL_Rhmol01G0112500 [Rhododendron molle]|uniref:Uncharacterized protein n=1 Tax=Rhododendron molle TaxID=49168 RepID=A0ACC0PZZ5_RHOML|nr:hypothetical protein RHMOL_Rhmol01G0112500 [Rhododendron molle]
MHDYNSSHFSLSLSYSYLISTSLLIPIRVLFECCWTHAVWFGSHIKLNVGHGPPISAKVWTSQVVDALKGKELNLFLSRVVTIAWYIWKSRNEFVFSSNPVNPEKMMRRAEEALQEFTEIRVPGLVRMDNPPTEDIPSRWRAPDQGCFKLNCDVAIKKNGKDAVCAMVQRDWKGQILNGSANHVKVTSSLQGELLAIRFACGMVKSLGYRRTCIESDNQQAIKLSVSESVPPWTVASIVMDIRELRKECEIAVTWVSKDANGLAHAVASKALRGLLPCNWVACPPPSVFSVLASEFSYLM